MALDPLVLIPAGAATLGALVCLGAEAFLSQARKHLVLPWTGAAFLLAGLIATALLVMAGGSHAMAGLFVLDAGRGWLVAAILAAGLIGIAGIQHSLGRDRYPGGEPYALALFAVAGAALMAQSVNTLALFTALEIASLSVYALVGLRRHRAESNEGLFKYFVMGAVFSAVFLYGTALAYGATGTTAFGARPLAGREALWQLGHGLMAIGLLFKVGAVPFHAWSPDAYTGAPVAVTGLMGAVIKVGGFAALATLWAGMCQVANGGSGVPALTAWMQLSPEAMRLLLPFATVFMILALLSIALGNLAALAQTSVRRIVAYSSIAQAGYLLFAFALPMTGAAVSLGTMVVYLVAYALATAAALTAVAGLAGGDDAQDDVASLAGQGRTHPLHGLVLTVALVATAGLPPTLGFIGKFGILADLVARGHLWLALAAIALSVVGAAYYLRLAVAIWVAEPKRDALAGPGLLASWAMALAAIALIALIALPNAIAPAAPAKPAPAAIR